MNFPNRAECQLSLMLFSPIVPFNNLLIAFHRWASCISCSLSLVLKSCLHLFRRVCFPHASGSYPFLLLSKTRLPTSLSDASETEPLNGTEIPDIHFPLQSLILGIRHSAPPRARAGAGGLSGGIRLPGQTQQPGLAVQARLFKTPACYK